MQRLLSNWPEVAQRLRSAKYILLFTDYDGTLTPIVERPELADMPEKTKELLQKLARVPKLAVGIISGRALSDLKSRVGLEGITYAGNHGLEIEGPGFSFVNPLAEEVKPLLRLLHQVLSRAFTAVRGAFVENKGLTLSVHYRQVEEQHSHEVANIFESIVANPRAVGKIKTATGKKVYEVRPAVEWDKGKAIELLVERQRIAGKKAPLVMFLGDDLTDEDGFKAVDRLSGISIFVGNEETPSRASYFVESPAEVQRFLELVLVTKERQ